MHSVCVDLQVCVGGYAHQLVKVHVHLQLDLVLVFTLVSVPMGGMACVHITKSMLLNTRACNHHQHSPYLLCASYWDGSITRMAQFHQFVYVAPATGSILATLHFLLYATLILPQVTASTPTTPSLFPLGFVYLFSFVWSSCRVVSSSPQSPKLLSSHVVRFWTCIFVPPLHFQQPSSFLFHAQVCYPLLLLMVLLSLMSWPFYLDILVYEELGVFIDRQAHRHSLNCISSCTLDGVLWPFSLGDHCTYGTERQKNTYDTSRHNKTHGNQSISWKPK